MLRRMFFVIGLILTVCAQAWAGTITEDFAAANQYVESQEYSRAIRLYSGIIEQGHESGALYFNLGNAYFKDGDLGHAILFYMKAKRLSPGDDDVHSNLEFARQFTSLQMEGVELNPINRFLESLVGPYHLSTLAWASSLLFVLFMLTLVIRFGLGVNTSIVRIGIATLLIVLIAVSMITTLKYRTDYLTRRAVLIEYEVPVRSGPSDRLEAEFEGVPGLVVEILSESGDYYNVLFENNRRGWVAKNLVAEI